MTKLSEFLSSRGPTQMYEAFWVPRTLWPFAVSLAEVVSPGERVLDVGAGTGLLTELALARTGAEGTVTAIEPTPFMIEQLHNKYDGVPRIEIVEGAIESSNLPTDSFDVILCHQVVQYLPDLPKAFSEFHRVLKAGGKLAVGVWSGPQDQEASPLEDGFRKHFGESFAPIHAWSFGGLTRLQELAANTGFAIDRLETEKQICRFESLEEMMNIHITGGMRFEDDKVLMGIFDIADEANQQKTDALLGDLKKELGANEGPSGFHVSFASDVLVATA